MEIQMSFDALPGMVIVMTSPDFPRGDHHCLNFEYEVRARLGMPLLEIHARITDYMLSGDIIWSSNQQISHRSSANVTVQAVEISQDMPYVLDFVGTLSEPSTTTIRLANIGFYSGQCTADKKSIKNITGNINML